MGIYWGDIHNHCGISYGYGSLKNALSVAREQMDFCAVLGHASWHDLPDKDGPYIDYLKNYHNKGFEKFAIKWEYVKETIERANKPHEFITFQGYEAHSCKYGDYHFISPNFDLPLIKNASPLIIAKNIAKKISPKSIIAIPHHIAYSPNYRGINWGYFIENLSPVVEVYSKHGCSISDISPYPYLHTMGPRDSRNTVETGLRLGKKFGFIASSDNHAGYPGSYGDGRLAVICSKKTRKEIWEALLNRRTYAVTGDKIQCNFLINGAVMGSEVESSNEREIELRVTACDLIDKIVLYKNFKPWKVICGETIDSIKKSGNYKVRLEMGWGRQIEGFSWHGKIDIQDGKLKTVETCFRGADFLSPSNNYNIKDTLNINKINNKIIKKNENAVEWKCVSFKNKSTLHSQTAALIFEICGDKWTTLKINLNGKKIKKSLGELFKGNWGVQLKNYNSESFLIHRAIPEDKYFFQSFWRDLKPELSCDIYYVEVIQNNRQCAWISPIYVLA